MDLGPSPKARGHISISNTVAVTGEHRDKKVDNSVLFCFSNQYVNINCSYTLFNIPHSFFMNPYKHIKGTGAPLLVLLSELQTDSFPSVSKPEGQSLC